MSCESMISQMMCQIICQIKCQMNCPRCDATPSPRRGCEKYSLIHILIKITVVIWLKKITDCELFDISVRSLGGEGFLFIIARFHSGVFGSALRFFPKPSAPLCSNHGLPGMTAWLRQTARVGGRKGKEEEKQLQKNKHNMGARRINYTENKFRYVANKETPARRTATKTTNRNRKKKEQEQEQESTQTATQQQQQKNEYFNTVKNRNIDKSRN